MIVSASRRTDIPAHYAPWFMERVRAGYVLSPNPMNARQVSRVTLTPDAVDAFVFWTKDIGPMLGTLETLTEMGYAWYIQHTLTPYDGRIEPGLRDKAQIASALGAVSERYGAQRIIWRYDPIIVTDRMDCAWHAEQFRCMAEGLAGRVHSVTISFVDLYAQLIRAGWQAIAPEQMHGVAAALGAIAAEYHLPINACSERLDLAPYGIGRARCIDAALIGALTGRTLSAARDANQRPGCLCAKSVDIGMYNTCPSGCTYCYANHRAALVRRHISAHRPDGALLTGSLAPGAVIRDRT